MRGLRAIPPRSGAIAYRYGAGKAKHVERHRHGGLEAVHHVAQGIAHRSDVAMAVYQCRGMSVIGVSITIGSPPLRRRISGAVFRLMID
jgi:hypothetical protein